MRIIGGEFSGRRITAPRGSVSRPTTDRTREAVFNVLAHRPDFSFEGSRVIDLFAGSGALGLEALSRGADFCLFVDTDTSARGAIRENVDQFGLFGRTRVHRRSAVLLGDKPANVGPAFDIVFLDPPYSRDLVSPALNALGGGGWLRTNALLVIEQAIKDPPPECGGFDTTDMRHYGDTAIYFMGFSGQ